MGTSTLRLRRRGLERTARGVLRHLLPLLPLLPLWGTFPAAAWAQGRTVPTPDEVLGITIGADSMLADWSQMQRYFGALASASPTVRLDTIGVTTLGRPLLLVTISDPANQTRLDAIRNGQAMLADPRGVTAERIDSLIRHAPVAVFINNNIHSTEIGSSQFSMVLAHRLATDPSYAEVRRNVVVLMTPSANPDGLDTVVAWYRANKGTRFEAGPLPWLYHPYVGHDNNRDWFMLTQAETRAISGVLYRDWFPEVVWDVHQMGSRGARLFVPPFSDPVNPNLDPAIVEAISMTGTAMAAALYDRGKTGVAHQTRFDLWWHGGFRTVPARHNMVGILSEAASARLASPVHLDSADLRQPEAGVTYPAPWPGGWWRLGDIIEYELLAADGLLRLVAAQREAFVRRFVEANRRAIARGTEGAPFAYALPPNQRDPWALHTVVDLLLATGIEIRRATAAFEADGRHYPAGTLVIPMAQPFRAHVKDLLERQLYPDRRRYPGGPPAAPYDAAGWTLPLQTGIDAPVIDRPFTFEGEPIRHSSVAPGTVHGSGPQRVLANRSNMESRTLAAALAAGARVWVAREPVRVGGATLEAGAAVIEQPDDTAALAALVAEHARSY
ncbi:MAG: M14 family metallopeptidase, partial [Gemmatimonadales bacterium]